MPLSPVVKAVVGDFGPGDEVSSWALVQGMLRLHREYGRGLAEKVASEPGPPDGERRTRSAWLDGVVDLLDRRKVPELHGRVLILGLARLDPQLQAYLSSVGLLDALQEELRERIEDLLAVAPTERLSDPTILHDDSPPAQDQLGRRGFAEALALWLTRFWQDARGSQGRSFVLHIHGPWGSGKTILRFQRLGCGRAT